MIKPVDIRSILSFFLLWISSGCSGPQKDIAKSTDNQADANESLIIELNAFDNFRKAEPYYRAGKNGSDSAAFYYEQLLKEYLTPDQTLLVINRLGYVKYIRENLSDSYYEFRKGIRLLSQISPEHLEMEGMAYYYLGYIQSGFNQSDSALFYFMEAQRIFRETGDPDHLFHYLCIEGIANEYHWNLEDYANAEKYYVQGEKMLETGRIKGGDSYRFRLFYSMSSMFRQKKEFDKALIYLARAQNIADSLNESGSMEISRALLSNIYRDQKRWELAKSLNLQAIQINSSAEGSLIALATYFNNMSFILINLKQYSEALLYCEKAFQLLNRVLKDAGITPTRQRGIRNHDDLIRASSATSDPSILLLVLEQMGICYDFRGTIYQETGKPDMAYRDYEESLHLRKVRYGNRHKRVAQINHLIGNYFLRINSPDSALYHYQQSIIAGSDGFDNPDVLTNPTLVQIENNVELIEVLRDKASMLRIKHTRDPGNRPSLAGSLDCFRLCDSLIDYIWNSYTNEDSRLYLEDTVHSIYDQAIETAYQLYQNDSSAICLGDIFHFMENSRYRYLSDNLTSIQAYTRARIPESLVRMLREADYYIKYFNRQKNEIPEKSGYYNEKLFEKIRQKDILTDSIDKAFPEVASIKSFLKSVTLDSLKERIRSNNDILIQYFSGNKHFFILSTNGKKTNIRMVEKDSVLLGSIDAMLEIPDSVPLSRPGYTRFAVNSLSLYEKLLKPSIDEYNDNLTTRLIIIPDGSLNQISFDALIRSMPDTSYVNYKSPDYLVNHFTISYAFSSGMLVADKQPVKSVRRNRVLALSYGVADSSGGSHVNLGWANRELDAIKGVVLSSCESGIGKNFRGEGVYSMARAFANAGCPIMVTTLWQIPDKSTALLMAGFYGGIREKLSPDQALRKSKTDYLLRADQYTSHPRFWASFIPLGKF
ncbi:MAG: CHAT domain-containing protein [Bacteroidia bacterium]|nr:CHAT domain-containing protein [Bacteroidia bacterium]